MIYWNSPLAIHLLKIIQCEFYRIYFCIIFNQKYPCIYIAEYPRAKREIIRSYE